MDIKLVTALFVVALQCFELGNALECYSCTKRVYTSSEDPAMATTLNALAKGDPDNCMIINGTEFKASNPDVTTCPAYNAATGKVKCGKGIYDLDIIVEGKKVHMEMWVRQCLANDDALGCTEDNKLTLKGQEWWATGATGDTRYCTCDEEKCNSANRVIGAFTLLVSLLTSIVIVN